MGGDLENHKADFCLYALSGAPIPTDLAYMDEIPFFKNVPCFDPFYLTSMYVTAHDRFYQALPVLQAVGVD